MARGKTTPASTPGSYRPATGERSRVAVAAHDGPIEPDIELANDVQDFFEANGHLGEDVELSTSDLRYLASRTGVPAVLADALNDGYSEDHWCPQIDEHIGLRFATAVAVINHYNPVAVIGIGGERIVFDTGDGRVLKVSIFGGEQSQEEQHVGTLNDPVYARVDPIPATVPGHGGSRQVAVATLQEQLAEVYIIREDAIAEWPALAQRTHEHSQIGRRHDGSLCIYDLA